MIYFRADGNSKVGMGHIMRTLSIAKEVMKEGECIYLCADEESQQFIKESGVEAIKLNETPFSYEEAKKIQDILKKDDTIVVDSYLVNNEYFHFLGKEARIVYLDDLCNSKFDVDVIINYNSYADEEAYISLYKDMEKRPLFVIGSNYVPLREEFRGKNRKAADTVSNVLITTGGGDIDNLSGSIAVALLGTISNKISLHIVCGAMNPNFEKLKILENANENVFVHKNVKNMGELISRMDMAISAGGSTTYELCSMNVPFVVFSYADNQIMLAKDMDKKMAAVYAGNICDDDSKEAVINKICAETNKFIHDDSLREKIKASSSTITDGLGAVRLARMLAGKMEG